jgi:hypothetical protein
MSYPTLMVQLQIGQSNTAVLDVARLLAGNHKPAILGVAAAREPHGVHEEDYVFLGEIVEKLATENRAKVAATEAEFRAALGNCEIQWRPGGSYQTVTEYLAEEARGADLIIVTADPPAKSLAPAERFELADFVIAAGRPVLAVPGNTEKIPNLSRAMVCWKDTPETRRAVSGALPLLQQASYVSLVQAVSDENPDTVRNQMELVCEWFKRHGVAVDPIVLNFDGNDALRLRAEALEQDPDFVVAGLFSTNSLRERVFGGVSRDLLLNHLDRCVLFAH